MDRSLQITPLRALAFRGAVYSVMPLLILLVIGNATVRSAAAPACVVKLKFSSDDKSDSVTNTLVKRVLATEGYEVIDDWLFTIWSNSNYDVKVVITHTLVPNYGFPVNLMGMHLFIEDSSSNVLLDSYIDRANLEDNLRASIPLCGTSPPSAPLPDSKVDAFAK